MQRTTVERGVALAALFFLVTAIPGWAQVPDEVSGLDFCPVGKDCLNWSAVAGAANYNVYSGRSQDLSGLLDASTDSCTVGSFVATTTGALLGDPVSGEMDWYLVTAANGMREQTAR